MNQALRSVTCNGTMLAVAISAIAAGSASFAQTACETAHVSASDSFLFEEFGFAVDISGGTALVGARGDTPVGAAYVFRFDGMNWVETQKLVASDGEVNDFFGFTVAIDGDVALVGTPSHLHGAGDGAAWVFRLEGSRWIEEQELLASDGAFGDNFGRSVSISGNVAVIAAPSDDNKGILNTGAAYVFRYDPEASLWVEEQKLTALDAAEFDGFGGAVAVSGDLAVIGTPGDDDDGLASGSAYVFRFDSSSWTQEQKLLASDGTASVHFGEAVSISDDAALVGASGGNVAGAAYVFRYNPRASLWIEEQKIVASDGIITDDFGKSVAIDGSTALIGARFNDEAGQNDGAAYVFRAQGGKWVEQDKLLPENGPWSSFFGQSVAISGDTAVVGAIGEDMQAGAAYLYAGLLGIDCNSTGRSDACDILGGASADANGNGVPDECECPWDLDGGGTVGIKDFLELLAAWGPNPGHPADFDGDGEVGIVDFLELLANWGPCP